jgi:hypothetical protein
MLSYAVELPTGHRSTTEGFPNSNPYCIRRANLGHIPYCTAEPAKRWSSCFSMLKQLAEVVHCLSKVWAWNKWQALISFRPESIINNKDPHSIHSQTDPDKLPLTHQQIFKQQFVVRLGSLCKSSALVCLPWTTFPIRSVWFYSDDPPCHFRRNLCGILKTQPFYRRFAHAWSSGCQQYDPLIVRCWMRESCKPWPWDLC